MNSAKGILFKYLNNTMVYNWRLTYVLSLPNIRVQETSYSWPHAGYVPESTKCEFVKVQISLRCYYTCKYLFCIILALKVKWLFIQYVLKTIAFCEWTVNNIYRVLNE